jgi:hypothetical protein
MLQRLVVAQVVAQGLRELGQREQEPMVGGPPPQHPPEALENLELSRRCRANPSGKERCPDRPCFDFTAARGLSTRRVVS